LEKRGSANPFNQLALAVNPHSAPSTLLDATPPVGSAIGILYSPAPPRYPYQIDQ